MSSEKTPYNSPLRATYRVLFLCYLERNKDQISRVNFMNQRRQDCPPETYLDIAEELLRCKSVVNAWWLKSMWNDLTRAGCHIYCIVVQRGHGQVNLGSGSLIQISSVALLVAIFWSYQKTCQLLYSTFKFATCCLLCAATTHTK